MYAASSVSNVEPAVSIVTEPVAGAVHANQIEWPPAFPAWLGSPGSFVMPTVVAVVEPLAPDSVVAFAKASFEDGGGGGGGAGAWIVHVRDAGVASAFPAASVARTSNVCAPEASAV
jgi:hypothetical protein